MNKNLMRNFVKEKILILSEEQKRDESRVVSQKLIEILSKEKYNTLIIYNPLLDEIDISKVTKWAINNRKTVITIPQNIDEVKLPSDGIIIVPGRAFTLSGIRLGRGGGFYDKILHVYPTLKSFGVCFDCQIFPDLPEESWDKRVNTVVFSGNTLQ